VRATDETIHERVEDVVAAHLAGGYRPDLRVLLTHERPEEICAAMRREGMAAWWVLYTPDAAQRSKRIAQRNLAAGTLRYMMQVWEDLYKANTFEVHLNDEDALLQYTGYDLIKGVA
jgi:hypothetical protein